MKDNKGVTKNKKARRTQSQLDKYLNFVESCKSKKVKRKVKQVPQES